MSSVGRRGGPPAQLVQGRLIYGQDLPAKAMQYAITTHAVFVFPYEEGANALFVLI